MSKAKHAVSCKTISGQESVTTDVDLVRSSTTPRAQTAPGQQHFSRGYAQSPREL